MLFRYLSIASIIVCSLTALGATPTQDSEKARQLARKALQAESSGNLEERQSLLNEASAAAANEPLVRWQQGEVRTAKGWRNYEALAKDWKTSRALERYREQRDKSEPTVDSQHKLAIYCIRNNLKEQSTAHWSAILELDPNNVEARKHLGFERYQGRWIKRQDVVAERTNAMRVADVLRRLTPELKEIAKDIENQKLTIAEATKRLARYADLTAIPAWEAIVSSKSSSAALAVIGALAEMTDPEASLSLARHALASESKVVQQAASRILKERDENSYLPALMAELRGPWIGWRDVATDGRNQLLYRFTMVADAPDQQTLRVLDQAYFLNGTLSLAAGMAGQSGNETGRELESRRQRENIQINSHNERVMKLLSNVTGEVAFDSPQDWWQWWDDRNEVYSASGKPINTSYAFRSASVVALPPPPRALPADRSSYRERHKKDCLAGGTPILTQCGPVAVERVRIGDLVLAQHPDTGEVSLQPVLRTTFREPENLIRIQVGEETLRASGGHPFWVSGQGWTRARELKPGMRLHGLSEAAEVRDVHVEDKAMRSFNLVVANFHSYFVGPGRILSHDNSVTEPTRTKVPGLSESD